MVADISLGHDGRPWSARCKEATSLGAIGNLLQVVGTRGRGGKLQRSRKEKEGPRKCRNERARVFYVARETQGGCAECRNSKGGQWELAGWREQELGRLGSFREYEGSFPHTTSLVTFQSRSLSLLRWAGELTQKKTVTMGCFDGAGTVRWEAERRSKKEKRYESLQRRKSNGVRTRGREGRGQE